MTTEHQTTLPSIEDRVAALRGQLARANGSDSVMYALANADFATLRAFEPDFFTEPVPITVLRQELAQAYLRSRGGE